MRIFVWKKKAQGGWGNKGMVAQKYELINNRKFKNKGLIIVDD
jgi:hypothetical protein